MGNYVIAGVGNYVIENPSDLGNFMIADTTGPWAAAAGPTPAVETASARVTNSPAPAVTRRPGGGPSLGGMGTWVIAVSPIWDVAALSARAVR